MALTLQHFGGFAVSAGGTAARREVFPSAGEAALPGARTRNALTALAERAHAGVKAALRAISTVQAHMPRARCRAGLFVDGALEDQPAGPDYSGQSTHWMYVT